MVNYKLVYFDFKERGEPIRLLFRYVGQKFEDKRISLQEWPEVKKKTPFGQLPVLIVDGKEIPESSAILRYLARKHGLAGQDEIETARIDALNDLFKDFSGEINNWYLINVGFRKGDKEEEYKTKFVPASEKFFPILKKHLSDAGNGFYFRSGLTWIDFYLAEYFDNYLRFVPDLYKKHPEFGAHSKKFHSLPQLQNGR